MEFKFLMLEIQMEAPWQCVTDDELLQKKKKDLYSGDKTQNILSLLYKLSTLLKGSNCFTEVNFLHSEKKQ